MDLINIEAKDFGPFEHIVVPLHKQGLVWVGGENRDTKAAKSNGSGKTAISRALTWCLWGDTIDGEKGDKNIRKGTKCAQVVTTLEGGWKVDRQRTKGAPRLQLIQPDDKPFKASRGDLQDKINELVGLDFQAFKNTVLYGQNDSARFANPRTKDAERKDMLHRIMRTEILKQCHEHVREQAKNIKAEVVDLESEIQTIQARIDEHDVEGIQERHKGWEQGRVDNIAQRKLNAKTHKQQAVDILEGALGDEEAEKLRVKIKKLEKQTVDGHKADKLADKVEVEIEKFTDESDELNDKAVAAATKADVIDEYLDELEGDECPTCGTKTDSPSIVERKAAKRNEQQEYETERKQLAGQVADCVEQIDTLKKTLKKHKQASREGQLALQEIGEIKDQIVESDKVESEADLYIEKARAELKRAKELRDADNPYQEQLETAQTKAKEHTETLKDTHRQLETKQDGLAYVLFWVHGFSGQGLPSFILDSVMPFITERTNHYLDTLADGDITMRFDTQREMKSSKGEYRDQISIDWTVEGIDGYPPSGGQLKKMEVATDLALMDLVATREGATVDLLMLDEVLDGLDDEGRQRVLQLLHELRSKRGSIFVISHETDIAEMFEKAIVAVKEGGVTSIQTVM